MVKKLLTLCLALVMLSVAVMASPVTYTFAADLEDSEEELTEAKTEEFGIAKFEVIKITETEAEGVVSQTAAKVDTSSTLNPSDGNVWWLLAKVEVGENWDMDNSTLSLSTPASGNAGKTTAYFVPSTQGAFDDASDGKLTTNLTKPSNVTGAPTATASRVSLGSIELEVKELAGAAYADSYDGTYLYFAMQLDNNGYIGKSRWAGWKLTVDGAKIISAVTEEKTEEFDIKAFTVLRITENGDTQTAASQSTSATMSVYDNVWLLVKVNVGANWKMDASTVKLKTITGSKKASDSYGYYVPTTKEAWEDAADGEIASTLTKPSAQTEKVLIKTGTGESGSFNESSKEVSFAKGECSSSYDGENLYFAIEFENAGVGESKWAKWTLTVDGKKLVPAVTDFSDAKIGWDGTTGAYTVTTATASGTAMLIVASFNDDTMVDAKVATIDAATKADGVISGTITDLEEGESVKIFLWDSVTLAPAIGVSEF